MTLSLYLSSHCISAINRSLSLCPLVCLNGLFSQDLANYPVGYTSYIETLKLTSQHTHTHTHTHTHKTQYTHNNKLSHHRPILQRLCPLSPWAGQRCSQYMVPWLPMGPYQARGVRISDFSHRCWFLRLSQRIQPAEK